VLFPAGREGTVLLRLLYLLFLTLLRKVISFITLSGNKHSCAKIKPLCRCVMTRLPFTTEFLFYVTSLCNSRHAYKKTMVFQVAYKSISFGLKKKLFHLILRTIERSFMLFHENRVVYVKRAIYLNQDIDSYLHKTEAVALHNAKLI